MAKKVFSSIILSRYSKESCVFYLAMFLGIYLIIYRYQGTGENVSSILSMLTPASKNRLARRSITRVLTKDGDGLEEIEETQVTEYSEQTNTGNPKNEDVLHNDQKEDTEPNQRKEMNSSAEEERTSRLPKALIIGVAKCGTTALGTFLNLHPDIAVLPWETAYFCDRMFANSTKEWYRKLMPPTFRWQITIEKSPCYFNEPSAVERIHEFNSSIKLMVVVKDPIQRLLSKRGQTQARRFQTNLSLSGPIDEWITNEDGIVRNEMIAFGTYNQGMENVYRLFKKEQVLIVDGDKLITDPLSELKLVESFLGVRHFLGKEDIYFNSTKGFYCYRQRDTGKGRCFPDNKGREHEKPSEDVLRKLKETLQPYSKNFLRTIDKQLDWAF